MTSTEKVPLSAEDEKAAGRSGRIRSIARSMQKVLRVTDSLKAFLIIVYLVSILM